MLFLIQSYEEIIRMIILLYLEQVIQKMHLTECSLQTGSEHLSKGKRRTFALEVNLRYFEVLTATFQVLRT